jgi:dihydropteroate synthase
MTMQLPIKGFHLDAAEHAKLAATIAAQFIIAHEESTLETRNASVTKALDLIAEVERQIIDRAKTS